MTISSVGTSCRQPSHHRSRTRGRLDLVMQESVTFLFSDWDADPKMVMALGGTAGRRTEERHEARLDASYTGPDKGLGTYDKVFGIRQA